MEKDLVRHGDILFRRTALVGSKGRLQESGSRVIAQGEVTGHAHKLLEDQDARILEEYEKTWRGEEVTHRFLEVGSPATVTHEEHGELVIPVGTWEILQAREFDYAANLGRRVRD